MATAAAQKPLPPGRFGLPWLGESLALVRSNHGFYRDRAAKHGPIFKTRLFGNSFVVFSGHEAFHTFATDPRIVRGDVDPITVEQMFADSLALIDGVEHHARKSIMFRGIGFPSALGSYLPTMQELLQRTIGGWVENGTATLRPDLQRFAARLTGALYTGDLSEEHAAELDVHLTNMRSAFMALPVPIPGTTFAKAIASRKRMQEIVSETLERHLTGDYDDVVSRMIAAAHKTEVPVDTIKGDIRHLIFAGQAGWFAPLTLTTMILGQHPDITERARTEVLAVSPEGAVTMEQIGRMPYLEQISKEVRRYFGLNSATFFGRVTEDLEIGGYRIPAGWGAIGGIHITMRNPDVFPDPDRFDPDRFEPSKDAERPPGSYVPHGDGEATGHRCPAENLVTVTIKLYLTLLLRETTWSIPEQDLTLTNELFPLPASGLTVEFRQLKRSNSAVTSG